MGTYQFVERTVHPACHLLTVADHSESSSHLKEMFKVTQQHTSLTQKKANLQLKMATVDWHRWLISLSI